LEILVIGYRGVVGNATYQLFKRLGHKVTGVDKGDKAVTSDVAFVCIPETEVTPYLLHDFRTRLFVIRSTVPPGTCELLQKQLGVHIAHNPEFLREATAVQDAFNPDRIVIGQCCKYHGGMLASLYQPLRRPIHRASRTVTELTKIACNGFLATMISYWNEVDMIAGKLGVSGTDVGMLASTDPRIGRYGSCFHDKFGGKCLPKDMQQLIQAARTAGLNPKLLEAVLETNKNVPEVA
jgi:UDPglucose 6-dehydrogenase